ncbi:MAG: ABC transporter ATP-binding protein [Acidimicrobiia bacterium]|nr:MAG: ABC transporter ATP-binding protein [Acidimicrobiia bacterium]
MLELHDLRKTYGTVVALDGCSFRVEPGRITGFLGPNGAGKTTTMRAIFGLVSLDEGTVLWQGRPVDLATRLRFGYMPEERGLYPRMKIADQLVYLGRIHGMDGAEARSEAARWLNELGLGDRASDPVESLSQGNQQRVQLAAALIHRPDLAVLDEPFSGLDPIGVDRLSATLAAEAERGAAVLFSSHQLDLVEDLCDDVVIIHRGRVVAEGPVDHIRGSSPHRVLEIDADGFDPAAMERRDGVVKVERRAGVWRVWVRSDLDMGSLVAAAGEASQVRHLSYGPPHLSDVFRELVA